MQFSRKKINFIEKVSNELRISILNQIYKVKKGHIGGSYSCLDILMCLYCFDIFKLKKKNFKKKNNDIFILSKGHSALALYSVLNLIKLSKSYDLNNFHKQGKLLMEHPSPNKRLPGIEIETGSLGNGIGVGAGMAFGDRSKFVITMVGDGELYEGSNWEAMMMASHYDLKNLIILVDRNFSLTLDKTENVIKLGNLKHKMVSFGLNTYTADGHNYKEILKTFRKILTSKNKKPSCIIFNTIKGKGAAYIEDNLKFHHAVPNDAEYKIILNQLNNNYD